MNEDKDNQIKDEKQGEEPKKGVAMRFIAKGTIVAVGASIAVGHSLAKGETFDVPPQAIGALVTGSIGSTAATVITPIISVPDTTIDKVYEARYATLRSDVEQGSGKADPKQFRLFEPST